MENTVRNIRPEKYVISAKTLLNVLRLVRPSVSPTSYELILSVEDTRLVLTSTNRMTRVRSYLTEKGYSASPSIGVSFYDLWKIAQANKKELIGFSWDADKLTVDSPDSSQVIAARFDCDNPVCIPYMLYTGISSEVFTKALPTMLKSTSQENPRNYGTVTYLYAENDKMGFVGTDGFRLAQSTYHLGELRYDAFNGICIGHTACKQLLVAAKTTQDMKIGLTEDKTTLGVLVGENTQIHIRLSAVEYPKYVGVIPKRYADRYSFEVKPLLALVKKALQTTDKSKAIKLTSYCGQLVIQTRRNEKEVPSEYSLNLPDTFTMPGEKLGINGQFLADCLAATTEESGFLHLQKNSDQPIKVELGSVSTIIVPIKETN